MVLNKVSIRYAKSLLPLALEKGDIENVRNDMNRIIDLVESNHEFKVVLKSPVIKPHQKEKVLSAVFAGQLTEMMDEFIKLLLRRGRESELYDIAKAFISEYNAHFNVVTAQVTSAVALDEAQREQVIDLVAQMSKGEVRIESKVDANLIGGLVIRVGDKEIDASVSSKLSKIRKELSENPYISEL